MSQIFRCLNCDAFIRFVNAERRCPSCEGVEFAPPGRLAPAAQPAEVVKAFQEDVSKILNPAKYWQSRAELAESDVRIYGKEIDALKAGVLRLTTRDRAMTAQLTEVTADWVAAENACGQRDEESARLTTRVQALEALLISVETRFREYVERSGSDMFQVQMEKRNLASELARLRIVRETPDHP